MSLDERKQLIDEQLTEYESIMNAGKKTSWPLLQSSTGRAFGSEVDLRTRNKEMSPIGGRQTHKPLIN